MRESWLKAQPCCVFDRPHLLIDYKPIDDTATGFILDQTLSGNRRKYLYEASFRDNTWRIQLTAADPDNRKPFFDRDGPSKSIRVINGMHRGHRKDLIRELSSKLTRFRFDVLAKEESFRHRASLGQRVEITNDSAKYFLQDATLIRIQRTIIREFVQAIELPEANVETAMKFLP